MSEAVVLSEDLEEMPPGPGLASVLAGIDRTRLNGFDLVTVLRAQARQVAHEQARLLADLVEVAFRPVSFPDAPAPRLEQVGEFAIDEIAAALCWTRRAAGTQLGLAWAVTERLPAVGRALSDGLIDVPRARVLCEAVAAVDDSTARAVVGAIVDTVGGLTTGQLAASLRRLVIAVDPAAARRRHDEAVAGRRVVGELLPDGTATLAGQQLPADAAAAARARIDALAQAVKAAGDSRSPDQLRADIMLALLTGTDIDESAVSPAGDDPAGDGPAGDGPAGDGPPAGDHADDAPTGDSAGPGGPGPGGPGPGGPGPGGPGPGGPGPGGAAPGCAAPDGVDPAVAGTRRRAPVPVGRRASIELTVPLTTLLGLAEDPGDIAGWGPVIADIARRIAADHPQGTWRYTIVDHTGRVLHHGNTRARPRAGVHQVNNRRRRPTAADAALVAARDRTCRAPGCRVPATSADLDHTRDWAYGGPTTPANLGVLCRHHHRLKHEGGWRLRQLFPGVFAWTSALGRSYLTGPEPHPP